MTIKNSYIGSPANINYKNLPNEYTQVKYIQNEILGYIDTGVGVTANTKVEADFQFVMSRYGYEASVFGVYNTNGRLRCVVNTSGAFNETSCTFSQTSNIYERTTVTAIPYSGYTSTTDHIYIFAQNQSGVAQYFPTAYYSSIKLFSLKIYENNTLVKDYIPAIRNIDGICGLYELVGNNFVLPSNVPSEYQLVDYIESTGTQYIDTNFTPLTTSGFFTKFNSVDSVDKSIFGVCDNNAAQAYYIETYSSGSNQGNFKRNSTIYNAHINKTDNNIVSYSVVKNTYNYDNSTNSFSIGTDTLDPYGKIYLFAINKNGTAYGINTCRISYIIFTGYGSSQSEYHAAHFYVSVIRKSDNKPGMYDLITDEFLINSGSDEFNYGNNIQPFKSGEIVSINAGKKISKIYFGNNNGKAKNIISAYIGNENGIAKCVYTKKILPLEYQQVEWIRNDSNAYINLGITPKKNSTKIETLVKFVDVAATGNPHIFGCQNSNNTNRFKLYTSSSKLGYGFDTTAKTLSRTLSNDMQALVSLDAVDLEVKIIVKSGGSGSTSTTFSNGTLASKNIYIFCQNNNGSTGNDCKLYMYSFKLWEGSTLKRNLYPCYRKSDNVAGMYDIVNNVFYPSARSGVTFAIGSPILQEL